MADGTIGPRVLIDTSLWIEFHHPLGQDHLKGVVRERILRDEVVGLGLIRAELCRGAKTQQALDELMEDMITLEELALTPGAERAFRVVHKNKPFRHLSCPEPVAVQKR